MNSIRFRGLSITFAGNEKKAIISVDEDQSIRCFDAGHPALVDDEHSFCV